MLNIGLSEFRANMNTILQRVQKGEIVTLTLRGTEVARLVPPDFAQQMARRELEDLRSSAVVGDVVSPIEDNWNAIE